MRWIPHSSHIDHIYIPYHHLSVMGIEYMRWIPHQSHQSLTYSISLGTLGKGECNMRQMLNLEKLCLILNVVKLARRIMVGFGVLSLERAQRGY